MGQYLEGDDEEKRTAYRDCIFSALTYGLEIMPVAIAMYRKYKTMHPDKLDAFVGSDKEAVRVIVKMHIACYNQHNIFTIYSPVHLERLCVTEIC